MATAENIALERRVAKLERRVKDQALLWIRTTIVVCGRAGEPEYSSAEQAIEAAEAEPEVVELRRLPDLEVLIDPLRGTKRVRTALDPGRREAFDRLKQREGVRLLDVEIRCHEAQVGAILSRSPIVAAFGGNRSGKSMILVWWLFRRWLLRGGRHRVFWWVGPDVEKLVAQGVWTIAGDQGLGGGVWPDEVFAELRACPRSKKNPSLELIDGSVLLFQHANFRGRDAGKNLKSANVTDAVVDELGAIAHEANWHQVQIRVSQTGGAVATSTTRVKDHWSHEEISERAAELGPRVIDVYDVELFANPWMSYARIWKLFLTDKTITRRQLEQQVLPAEDKRGACLALVTNPKSLREHFGIETARSLMLWPSWEDRLIYSSPHYRHAELVVERDGELHKLKNITAEVLARKWPKQAARGVRWHAWAGVDFNVRGHSVILELFGDGASLEEAIANTNSWTVLVSDEVQIDGTTLDLAQGIRERAGIIPVWYDPHGAPGHASRGTGGDTTDAAILRQTGFPAAPANGVNIKTGSPMQLGQIDSRNVMHALMAEGRLRVHERCVGWIQAMATERAKPDGRADKRSSPDSPTDFLSGFTDSGRYGIWPIFKGMFARTKQAA